MVVPFDKPVTNPVAETVATAGLDDNQGSMVAGTPEPVNCDVPPLQKVKLPEIVGFGLTIIVVVAVVAHCPAVGVKV